MDQSQPDYVALGGIVERRHRRGAIAALLLSGVAGGFLGIALLTAPADIPRLDEPRPNWWEKATVVDGIPRAEKAPIALEIQLVAGADGGLLRADGNGWVAIELCNRLNEPVWFHTAYEVGKAWPVKDASYAGYGHYTGFAVAALRAEFVDKHDRVVFAQMLSPPDTPVQLEPHPRKTRTLWRRIRGPGKAGVYLLRVALDTLQVCRAWRTYNIGHESEPAFTAVCVAKAVRVAEKEGG